MNAFYLPQYECTVSVKLAIGSIILHNGEGADR